MISYWGFINNMILSILSTIAILVILVYSAILHEIAHGLVAEKFGDPTARLAGRITLNPKNHIDLYMTIILPLITFYFTGIILGGAKPVPVDPFNLQDGRKDLALVSLAGPVTNFILAIIFSLICHILFPGLSLSQILASNFLGFILGNAAYINLALGIFNLMPVPPLDGSKIFALLLPESIANAFMSLGTIGLIIILFLFMSSGFGGIISSLLSFSLKLLGM